MPLRPIYLLSDSQLLFWKNGEELFLHSLKRAVECPSPRAAYVGASNHDLPEFYQLFEAAMSSVGINQLRMTSSALTAEDADFLERAEIILLAGGDVEHGWSVFQKNGLDQVILRRYYDGALLIGVSAGAVQLGLMGWPETGASPANLIHTLKLVPFVVSAHEERSEWRKLKEGLQVAGINVRGLGLPSGGGAIYHADFSLEPIRYPVYEFSKEDQELTCHLLFPETQVNVSGEA